MKAKLFLKDLSDRIKAAVPPNKESTLDPMLNNVLIRAKKAGVSFSIFSTASKTTVNVPCSVIEPGECLIPVQLLYKLLNVNKEYATIETSEGSVHISAEIKGQAESLGEYKIAKADEEEVTDAFEIDYKAVDWTENVDPKGFMNGLLDVLSAMEEGEQALQTSGVCVREGRFIATNRHVSSLRKSRVVKDAGLDFIIPSFIVPRVVALCSSAESLKIGKTDRFLIFESPKIRITSNLYEHEFLADGVEENIKEILKTKASGEFDAVFPTLLEKAQVVSLKDGVDTVRLKVEDGKATISSEDTYGNRFDANIPGYYPPEMRMDALYNIQFIKRVLPQEGAIKFYVKDNYICIDKSASFSVIMPLYKED